MEQRRPVSRALVLVAFAIVAGAIVLRLTNLDRPMISFANSLLEPLQSNTFGAINSIRSWFSPNQDPDTAANELERVSNERDKLLVKLAQLQSTITDMRLATGQAKYLDEIKLSYVVARVIGRNIDPATRIIILNQGLNRNVRIGQAVVAENGILIGRIYDVTETTSQVLLLSDRRSRVAALVQNERSSPGIVTGELGLALRLEFVPQDEKLDKEQLVVTSGFESGVPRGLLIGQIERVNQTPTDLFQSASLSTSVDLDRLQIVSVIIE